MSKRLLELFSCQGVGSVGYHRADWTVYGIDNDPAHARYYPFALHVGDALTAMRILLDGGFLCFTHPDGRVEWLRLVDFDAAHGSPPCQALTRGNAGKATRHLNLIPQTRELMLQTGLPYVIENVEDAAGHLLDPVTLCGTMFDLRAPDEDGEPLVLTRHRLFETNWPLPQPEHGDLKHRDQAEWIAGVYNGARLAKRPLIGATPSPRQDRHAARYERKGGYVPRSQRVRRALMGVDFPTTAKALTEALPPAYTEYIGHHLTDHVSRSLL